LYEASNKKCTSILLSFYNPIKLQKILFFEVKLQKHLKTNLTRMFHWLWKESLNSHGQQFHQRIVLYKIVFFFCIPIFCNFIGKLKLWLKYILYEASNKKCTSILLSFYNPIKLQNFAFNKYNYYYLFYNFAFATVVIVCSFSVLLQSLPLLIRHIG
jgi:hypothetical protein